MKIVIPVIISSFFLESIVSNFIALDSNLFIPLFSIISLVIIYPYFNNDDFKYFKYCTLIGLAYDIIFTNTLIFNMVIFLCIGIIIKIVNFFISNNPLNIILIGLIAIISYRILVYIVLVIIGYLSFDFSLFLKAIYSSLLLNILFGIITYILTDYFSRKYKIPKMD